MSISFDTHFFKMLLVGFSAQHINHQTEADFVYGVPDVVNYVHGMGGRRRVCNQLHTK